MHTRSSDQSSPPSDSVNMSTTTSTSRALPSSPSPSSATSANPRTQSTDGSVRAVVRSDGIIERIEAFFKVPNNIFYVLLAHGFLCNGLVLAALGPSLLSLSQQTHSTLQTIVYIFTARSLGHLVGTFVGGFVVDKWSFHQRTSFLVPMVGLAFLTCLVPNCSTLWSLIMVIFGQGFCSGWIDNVCQVLCIRYKTADGVNVHPYLQSMHFFFAFGAVIAPFIFAGFLGSNAFAQVDSGSGDASTDQNYNVTDSTGQQTSEISVASASFANGFYVIFGLIMPGVIALFWYVFINKDTFEIDTEDIRHCVTMQPGGLARTQGHRGEVEDKTHFGHSGAFDEVELADSQRPPQQPTQEQALEAGEIPIDGSNPFEVQHDSALEESKQPELGVAPAAPAHVTMAQSRRTGGAALIATGDYGFTGIGGAIVAVLPHLTALGFVMVGCIGMLMFFYLGMENYSNFIFTYGINILKMDPVPSAVMNSTFWIAFALGRMCAIPLSHVWSPSKILLTCLSFSMFWMFLLIFAPNSGGYFWFITVVYGFSSAPIYPTIITWAEQYLKVTGKILSAIIMFDCVGAATLPLLMAYTLNKGGSMGDGFVFVMLWINVAAFFFFFLLLIGVIPKMSGDSWQVSIKKALKFGTETADDQPKTLHQPGSWHS